IVDRTEMALRNVVEFLYERDFRNPAPGANRKSSMSCQCALHFSQRGRLVLHELQALLAYGDIKAFPITQWEGSGIALAPVDRGSHFTRDAQHVRAEIHTDNMSAGAQLLSRHSCHNSRSTSDIEDPVSAAESDLLESSFSKRTK